MTNYVQRTAGTSLSEDDRSRLRALSKLPDDQIDLSDIPESTEEQLRNARPRRRALYSPTLDKAS